MWKWSILAKVFILSIIEFAISKQARKILFILSLKIDPECERIEIINRTATIRDA